MFIVYGILALTVISVTIFSGSRIYKTFFTNAEIQFIDEK